MNECRLMTLKAGLGVPEGPQTPPSISTGATKAKGNGKCSGEIGKDKQKITKNMTMSTCDYEFKSKEIRTI